MFPFSDERLQRVLAVAFLTVIGIAIGMGAWQANGAEMDSAWFGQSTLVVLAFTFAMRSSQEFREARARRDRNDASRNTDDRKR